jgi:hypothetical protein
MSNKDSFKSDRPAISQSGFSGAMPYNYGGVFGSIPPQQLSYEGSTISKLKNNLSYQNTVSQNTPASPPTIVTIQICVGGTPKRLDVYASGNPY